MANGVHCLSVKVTHFNVEEQGQLVNTRAMLLRLDVANDAFHGIQSMKLANSSTLTSIRVPISVEILIQVRKMDLGVITSQGEALQGVTVTYQLVKVI